MKPIKHMKNGTVVARYVRGTEILSEISFSNGRTLWRHWNRMFECLEEWILYFDPFNSSSRFNNVVWCCLVKKRIVANIARWQRKRHSDCGYLLLGLQKDRFKLTKISRQAEFDASRASKVHQPPHFYNDEDRTMEVDEISDDEEDMCYYGLYTPEELNNLEAAMEEELDCLSGSDDDDNDEHDPAKIAPNSNWREVLNAAKQVRDSLVAVSWRSCGMT